MAPCGVGEGLMRFPSNQSPPATHRGNSSESTYIMLDYYSFLRNRPF